MIGYPCDRKMNVLGMVTNRSIAGITISNDKRTEELEYGSTVLSLDITYDNSYRSKAKDLFKVGNYLLVHFSDKDDYYTIIDREDDYKNNSINLYCENCGLDLLNEIAGEYKADKEYDIAHYVNTYIYDTGFEIKINELGDSIKKQLSLSSGETLTSRILSIAKEFEAEIDYTFEIDKLSVVHKYINIYKKRGNEDQNVELRLNREIDNIICTESISELVTAFSMVTGGTPEGQNDPINLINYDYDDGDIYVEKSSGWVFSRKGLENWSRYLSETGTDVGHIVGTFSYDTTDQKTLCDKTVEELKKKAKPKTEYDIELSYLPDNVKVGDTVLVSDEDGNTYFTARLTKIESSDTEKEVTVTFGDFEAKEPTISQQLKDLADQFNKVVQQRPLYTWFAYADDVEGNGISLEPGDKKYLGVAYNKLQEEVDISDPSIFTWSLIQGPQGDKGETGDAGATGPQGPQGEKGDKGDTGPQGPQGDKGDKGEQGDTGPQGDKGDKGDPGQNGADGNGISNIVEYYQVSTSNTTPPSSWLQTVPTLTATNKYLWNYEKISYTNGDSFETKKRVIGVYGDKGNTGATGPQGPQGDKGETGNTGATGNGIKTITNRYLATSAASGVTISTSGWTTTIQSPTATKKYLWNYETIIYTNGQNVNTTPCIIGVYGDKGNTGDTGPQGPQGDKGDTGEQGVSVASTVRYYKLSTSTPSKPTSRPPSGWTTTEPTYVEGSKESLYFTDLTIFSNATYSYSDVSLSSSYEAAKKAYEEALEAKKTATNFIEYNTSDGLILGNKTNGQFEGIRSQLTANRYIIKDESGNELSSFGKDTIELGNYSDKAIIYFCDKKGVIRYVIETEGAISTKYLELLADNLRLRGNELSSLYIFNAEKQPDDLYSVNKHEINVFKKDGIKMSCKHSDNAEYNQETGLYEGVYNESIFNMNWNEIELYTPEKIDITSKYVEITGLGDPTDDTQPTVSINGRFHYQYRVCVISGTVIVNPGNNSSVIIHTISDIIGMFQSRFGFSPSQHDIGISYYNGDGNACGAHVNGAMYLNGYAVATLNSIENINMRINYCYMTWKP